MPRFLETPCADRVLVVEGATASDFEFMAREQEYLSREHKKLANRLHKLAQLTGDQELSGQPRVCNPCANGPE